MAIEKPNIVTPQEGQEALKGEVYFEVTGLTAGVAIGEATGGRLGITVEKLVAELEEAGYKGLSILPTRPIAGVLNTDGGTETLLDHVAMIGDSWNADTLNPADYATSAKYLIATLPPQRTVRPIDFFMFPNSSEEALAMKKAMDYLNRQGRPYFFQTHQVEEALELGKRLASDNPNARVAIELKPDNYQEVMELLQANTALANLPIGLALDTRHAREALRELESTTSYPGAPTTDVYGDRYLKVLETIYNATSLVHFQGIRQGMSNWLTHDRSELWQTVTGNTDTELYRFTQALQEVTGNRGLDLPICVEHHFTVAGQMEPGAKSAIAQAKTILDWLKKS